MSDANTIKLPVLKIVATGMVTSSNLAEFEAQANLAVSTINTDLKTDEDFANAKSMIAEIKSVEDTLEDQANKIVEQTCSVKEVLDSIAVIKECFRQKRLSLNTQVTTKEAAIKREEINKAAKEYADHVAELEAETKPLKLTVTCPNMDVAAKGARSINGLKASLNTALMEGKIAADANAKDLRAKLAFCKAEADGYGHLFRDLQTLAAQPMESFKKAVQDRVAVQKEAASVAAEMAAAAATEKLEKERTEAEKKQAAPAAQEVIQQAAAVAEAQPAAEQPKTQPEAAKLAAAPEAQPATVRPATLLEQATHDCVGFMFKYKDVKELEWVMTEMVAFIEASKERKAA